MLVIGSMAAVWLARDDSFGSGLIAAAVTVVVATASVVLGRVAGALRADDGLVVLQSDRLEISDAATFRDTLILPRASILDVTQPGVAGTGPAGLQRVELGQQSLLIGPDWPNIEIWLVHPAQVRSATGDGMVAATRITMLTPGAAALLAWFRSELLEEPPGSMFRRVDAQIPFSWGLSGRSRAR